MSEERTKEAELSLKRMMHHLGNLDEPEKARKAEKRNASGKQQESEKQNALGKQQESEKVNTQEHLHELEKAEKQDKLHKLEKTEESERSDTPKQEVTLQEVRLKLDEVDRQIVKLYQERMALSVQVAESKMRTNRPVRDAGREKEKLESVKNMVEKGYDKKNVEELFRMLMAASRKYQYHLLNQQNYGTCRIPFQEVETLPIQNCRVVYTGVEGSFAHQATVKYFGSQVSSLHVPTFEESMNALSGGRADFAVIPIENVSTGVVADVYDLLVKCDNYIVDEMDLPVEQSLLVVPGTKLQEIDTVFSHPQGLSQCSKFLNEHKEIKAIERSNTALAAKMVAEEGNRSHAAIASKIAGELYGLETLISPLNHNLANMTRFAIISNRKISKKDAQHISICFETEHDPGSLYRLMSHIIYNNLNMTKLESRQVHGQKLEYRFFINYDGNFSQSSVKNALTGISEEAVSFKILGSF